MIDQANAKKIIAEALRDWYYGFVSDDLIDHIVSRLTEYDDARNVLFVALDELGEEIGEVSGLGSIGLRKNAVIAIVNSLFPNPPPKDNAGKIERTAVQLWRAKAECEDDWEGEPYTDEDWLKLTTENERQGFRKRAAQLLREIRS